MKSEHWSKGNMEFFFFNSPFRFDKTYKHLSKILEFVIRYNEFELFD